MQHHTYRLWVSIILCIHISTYPHNINAYLWIKVPSPSPLPLPLPLPLYILILSLSSGPVISSLPPSICPQSQHSPTPRKMQSLSYNPQPASTHINTHHNTTQHITQVTTHSSCPIPSLLHLPNSRNPHSQKFPLNHIIPSSHIPHPTSQLAHGSPLQNPTFFHWISHSRTDQVKLNPSSSKQASKQALTDKEIRPQ